MSVLLFILNTFHEQFCFSEIKLLTDFLQPLSPPTPEGNINALYQRLFFSLTVNSCLDENGQTEP